jgi:predicted short-subunit dehydrogenase-like oxidoreductase (DUF2520 family)
VKKQSHSERPPTISIVGPGNLGAALASTLPVAGYQVKFIAVRSGGDSARAAKSLARRLKAKLVEIGKHSLDTDIVWITVADDAIADVALTLARSQDWKGKVVFHSSGALTSEELAPLRNKGAQVASVHPMMTFVRGTAPEMAGVAFALEGDAAAAREARAIVESLGGRSFSIEEQNKVLYHVFGSFASPLIIALVASLEEVARAAGIRESEIKPVVVPLIWQTLRNYLTHDAEAAFSGPLVRGDVTTVRKHLAELQRLPEARAVYVALANAALKNLPVKNKAQLQRELTKKSDRRKVNK